MLRALVDGFRAAARAWNLFLFLYVLVLILALPLALALKSVVAGPLGMTLSAQELLKGFDAMLYDDFMTKYSGRVYALITAGTWSVMIYALISALLGGGIVGSMASGGALTVREILEHAGRFLGRMLRMFALFAVVFTIISGLCFFAVGAVVSGIDSSAISEKPVVIGTLAALALTWLFMLTVMTWFELAKIGMVTGNKPSVLGPVGNGFVFMFKNILPVFGIEFVLVLTQVILIFVYLRLEGAMAIDSVGGVFLMILLQQALVAARLFGKIWNTGALVALHQARTVAAAPADSSLMASAHQPEAGAPNEAAPLPVAVSAHPPADELKPEIIPPVAPKRRPAVAPRKRIAVKKAVPKRPVKKVTKK